MLSNILLENAVVLCRRHPHSPAMQAHCGEKAMQGIFVHPRFPLAAPSRLLEDGEEENLCLLLQEPNQMIPQPLLALKSPPLFSTASS